MIRLSGVCQLELRAFFTLHGVVFEFFSNSPATSQSEARLILLRLGCLAGSAFAIRFAARSLPFGVMLSSQDNLVREPC